MKRDAAMGELSWPRTAAVVILAAAFSVLIGSEITARTVAIIAFTGAATEFALLNQWKRQSNRGSE